MQELFIKRFLYYKELGDKTFEQLSDEQVLWQYNAESNSIAAIVKHISGNMISRWTHFLTEDGEKDRRNRDAELVNDLTSKEEMLQTWEKGWTVLFDALNQVSEENINRVIFIRGEERTVLDTVLRQLAHYSYHIGQIIYAAKMLKKEDRKNLSIPPNQSEAHPKARPEEQEPHERQQNASPVCYANDPEVRGEYKT